MPANLAMTVEWIAERPDRAADEWDRTATHWRCTIRNGRRSMLVYFSQGSAHTAEPTLDDVMSCLALDAMGADNARSFDEWCGEYGYDTDSRKAERIYRDVARQAARLRSLLGDDYAATLEHYASL